MVFPVCNHERPFLKRSKQPEHNSLLKVERIALTTLSIFAIVSAPLGFCSGVVLGVIYQKIGKNRGSRIFSGGCSASLPISLTKIPLSAEIELLIATAMAVEHLVHHSHNPILHRIAHFNITACVTGFAIGAYLPTMFINDPTGID